MKQTRIRPLPYFTAMILLMIQVLILNRITENDIIALTIALITIIYGILTILSIKKEKEDKE